MGLPPGLATAAISLLCSCPCAGAATCHWACPCRWFVSADNRRRSVLDTPVWSTSSTSTRFQSIGRARRPSRSEPPMPSRHELAWQIRSSRKPSWRTSVGVSSFSSRGAPAPSTTRARSIPAARAFCNCCTSSGTPRATKPPLGRPSRRLRPAASSSRQGRGPDIDMGPNIGPGMDICSGGKRRSGLACTGMSVSSRICRTIHRPPCGGALCSRPSGWRAWALCCSRCLSVWPGTARR